MSSTVSHEPSCPLCVEPLDATERSIQYCPCGFPLCRFCYKKLMETESGRCPNCRELYDESKVISLTALELADDASTKKKKKKGDRKRGLKLTGQERRNLQELRILQRNLVYAVGLSLDICIESVLAQNEFFGQFGPIKKISVNRSSPYSSGQSRNGPTGAAYVTYEEEKDAGACVAAIDGAVWDGHYIRACFGTTKYCQAFLKGAQCNNPDCLYMHYLVNEGTFTKEEMNSGFAKGKPEFYDLINFDRSKGPVPGSLAKPPKGPGNIQSRNSRTQPGTDVELNKQDWPQLSKTRSSAEVARSHIEDRPINTRMSEGSWTANSLKTTASGSTLLPNPLQAQNSTQGQKKVAVLSSPVKMKLVSSRSARGAVSSPIDPPFGHPVTEENLIPRLSTDSNLSHVSLPSDGQSLESNISGLFVPHNAAAESRLRATKSATPLEDDLARDITSMEEMLRRRISVPERMVDEASSKLFSTGSRRGPPPGFNSLQGRASAHDILERAAASERMLKTRMSLEAAAEAVRRQTIDQNLIDQLAKNMMTTTQPTFDLQTGLMGSNRDGSLPSLLESPFGGTETHQNLVQPSPNYPLGYNPDMQNELLQSLISASSGLANQNLQQRPSQLSARGSLPMMQTRLSADAIDRTAMFDLESIQKNQRAGEGDHQQGVLSGMIGIQETVGLPDQMRLEAEQLARQRIFSAQTNTSPFNDPAVLAFKKSGQQGIYQMGRAPDQLMTLREQTAMPPTPFDDPTVGAGYWSNGGNVPASPFLVPGQTADGSQWQGNVHPGLQSSGIYSEPSIDASGIFKVSTTQT